MPRGPRRKVPPAESSNSNSSINNNSVFLENDNKENGVIKTFTKEDAELARAALLNAVKDNKDTTRSTRPFLNLFGAAGSNSNASITLLKPGLSMREQRRMLLRALQQDSTKKEVARTYFASLQNLVRHVVERQEFIPESAFANDDEEEQDDDQKVTPDARSTEGLQFLYYATLCVKSYFTGLVEQGKQGLVIAEVHEIAVALHDTLDQLETSWGPDAANAHQAIVALCETWWLHNGVNREDLIGQALPAIVGAAMHCNKSDIKRLYSIRSALQVIDFEDADSEAFLSLLMHVASSPACLKTAEGKRFLAHLFSLGSSTMRRKLHYSIRAQIPDNKESILQDYSEVYFTAWKDAPPDERQALETDVLQDLMYAVLHAANPSLVQSLLIVLSKFHDNKQSADVEALMYRMYGPVIWRAMTAANARVRINAVSVFAQVFPLQQAASTTTTKTTANNNNTAVHKGCTALKQLLQDPDPRVRVAASAAVAQILSVFWDVIPSNEIRSLLNHLVAEHASDATSSAVRIGAVNAIATLLDAPQSHAVLRELLPSLGNLIHDKVEKVRLAVVRMLLRIKGIPKVKYYHIVPNDHLQARLAEEGKNNPTNSVASALTSLMVNSFFPKDPKENIRHALKFLTEDPDSAAVFFANVSKFRSADSVAQLTVQLLRCLHSSVEKHVQQEMKLARTATGKRIRSVEANDDDDDAESSEPPPAYVMAYLAETISTLWQSIEAELPRYAEWNKFLLDEFSGPKLTTILTYFEKKAMNGCPSGDDDEIEIFHDDCSRTCSAILRCAGRLPSTAVQDLVPYISSILASVQDSDGGDIPMENVTAHIALLCLWDLTDEVAQSLSMSIRSAFQEDTLFNSPAADTRKRSSRRPRTSDVALAVPQLPPLVALNVLGGILCGAEPSSVGAREAILSSKTACIAIENALKEGKRHAEFVLEGDSSVGNAYAKYLLSVFETFGRFALHKEAFKNGGITFSDQAKLLLHWTTAKVVPAFNCSPSSNSPSVPFIDPNLSSIQVEKSFDTFPSSPDPGCRPRRRVNRNKTPERLDEGLGFFDESPAASEAKESALRVRRAVAVNLMNSSCVLFSEWLAVGGTGSSFIAQAAVDWSQIFEINGTPSETPNELAPAFCRLAIQLAKFGGDYSLTKQLLTKLSDRVSENEDAPVLGKALASLLATRGDQADTIARSVVHCVVDAACELLNNETGALEFKLPDSLATMWETESGCISSGLSAILGSQAASLELARQLVNLFPTHAMESPRIALFDAKCLWILCDPEGRSKISAEASAMVRQLNSTELEEELSNFVEALVGACISA